MNKVKILLFLFALGTLSFLPAREKLSDLRIFNRAMLLVKEQYVDPTRVSPQKMLTGALDALEKQIPELVIEETGKNKIRVQMKDSSKIFSKTYLKSLWDLSFFLRDILEFIEPKLSPDTKFEDIEYAVLNGSLGQLDPHSILLEPKFSKEMKLSTKGEFGGLGIVIGLRDGLLTVISPLDETPAAKAGIRALDQIIKIDDSSTINLALDEAVEKLRGKPGSVVSLTIQRKGEASAKTLNITRDIIKVEAINSHLIDSKIGYVKIKSFHGNTAEDLRQAIDKFGDIKGLILDFRNNPGGLLTESVSVSDLFLDGGVVVVTRSAAGTQRDEEKASPGPDKTKLPIIVLVNSGSASASEIVAGALKNRSRALVIGEQTFGKGSVQMLYDFPDKSALKLTIAQYLTPGDESIQSVGITPDIEIFPAYLEDKNSLLIFPQTKTREGDLELHLDDKLRIKNHKSEYDITYVSEKISPDEQEKRSVSKTLYEDFEIRLAKRLLLLTKSSHRQDLLQAAKQIVPKIEEEEQNRIVKGLRTLGIDWSLPAEAPELPKLEFNVLKKPISKAGDKLKIIIEAKNMGKVPVYQLYGISKSDSPFLSDREFVFGKIVPKSKKIWTAELEVPKEILTQQNLMTVEFKANNGKPAGSLKIPVAFLAQPKPVLAFQYQILPGVGEKASSIKVTVKNIGSGIAAEPVMLLRNTGESDIFIEQGRQKLKALKPGESINSEFSFVDREHREDSELQIQLYDGVSGEYWVDNIDLRSLKPVEATPPAIKWISDVSEPILAGQSYELKVGVEGRPSLKDVYLYVNDQKVLYKVSKNKKLALDEKIKLKPGVNYITLVARSGQMLSQREMISIYSE